MLTEPYANNRLFGLLSSESEQIAQESRDKSLRMSRCLIQITVSKWFISFSVGQGYSNRPPIKLFVALTHGANRWSYGSKAWKTFDLPERIVSKFALSAVKEISFLRLLANGTDSYILILQKQTY